MVEYGLVIKYRRGSYYLALKSEIIKTLELDQLLNIKNAILFSLFYVLISNLKKF